MGKFDVRLVLVVVALALGACNSSSKGSGNSKGAGGKTVVDSSDGEDDSVVAEEGEVDEELEVTEDEAPVEGESAPGDEGSVESYEVSIPEQCTTGEQEYQTLNEYCDMLQNDTLNNSCARERREEMFYESCEGEFTSFTVTEESASENAHSLTGPI